ncbi:MAG TPA: M67 family metallopeptidase [Actinomycetota bacterium]|nr:M67 family metallopeptidase [Actinomycetota bacterium]
METFEIPEAMVADMVAHAQAEYPSECCGVIGGDGDGPRKLFRLRNVDPDPVMRYAADPKELKRATDDIYDADWEIVCIYHSHTHSPAFPSPTDVERALYPEAVYALVTLQDRQNPELRAFRIVEGTITELKVVRT